MAYISSNGKTLGDAGKGVRREDRVRKETGKTFPRDQLGREGTGFPNEHPRRASFLVQRVVSLIILFY